MSNKWSYLSRTISGIGPFLQLFKNKICYSLIPALSGRAPPSNPERNLFSPPARGGGIAFCKPSKHSDMEYSFPSKLHNHSQRTFWKETLVTRTKLLLARLLQELKLSQWKDFIRGCWASQEHSSYYIRKGYGVGTKGRPQFGWPHCRLRNLASRYIRGLSMMPCHWDTTGNHAASLQAVPVVRVTP